MPFDIECVVCSKFFPATGRGVPLTCSRECETKRVNQEERLRDRPLEQPEPDEKVEATIAAHLRSPVRRAIVVGNYEEASAFLLPF